MRITEVTYSRIKNLGNYENERIELKAMLEEKETVKLAVGKLKKKVSEIIGDRRRGSR